MKGEWWEILITVVVVTIAVWIKGEVDQQHLAEYTYRRVMEMWLSGQGPPNLYAGDGFGHFVRHPVYAT